jgi:glycosyltransferase involved in cell wall biosynthesis
VRIGIDARLADYTAAGIARYTVQITRALYKLTTGHELVALRSRRPKVEPPAIPADEELALYTPPHHRLERFSLGVELRGARLDLLHSPDFIAPRGPWRKVVTVHDLAFLRLPWLLTRESRRYYNGIRGAVRDADAIIAVSQATADDIRELLDVPGDRVHVIYEAADPDLAPMSRAEAASIVHDRYGLPSPFVLFVGTIEPRKNLPTLVEAIALLRREMPVRLAVAGRRGWLSEPVFDKIRRLAAKDGVVFLGEVTPQDLRPLYGAAEVVALPSLYEGFGLPPLEAMACGTPVVVSNAPALAEVVGDAGVIVRPDAPDDIANGLAWVLGNAAFRATLVERGLARAATFSWERAARETLAVYERVGQA